MLGRSFHSIAVAIALNSVAIAQRTDVRFTVVLGSWDEHNDSAQFMLTAVDTAKASIILTGVCSISGKCRIDLPLDHVYRVEFSGTGHVPEHLIVDLNGPTIKQRKWGYRMRIALTLMPRIDPVDYSICERPISYAHFDPKDNQFIWDERYTFELTPYYETMQNQYKEVKAGSDGRH